MKTESTLELLSRLHRLNVKLYAERGTLRYAAPAGAMTSELRAEVAGHKSEILAFLQDADEMRRPAPPTITKIERNGDLPLSFGQMRLWLVDQIDPLGPTYNFPSCFHLKGRLDQGAFEQSFIEVLRRHEVLRTYIETRNGQPILRIVASAQFKIGMVDLQMLPDAVRKMEADRLVFADSRRQFSLGEGPLVRATLLKLDPEEHLFLLNLHHVVFDGWSVGLLLRELSTLYNAYLKKEKSPLPELNVQYADFAAWQRQWLQGENLRAQVAYWKKVLGGRLPVLELPADRPRPSRQSYNGATYAFALSRELMEGLRTLSQNEGVTLFVALLAALQVLLLRYTGQEDILVGTPIANRNQPETEDLIGFFVNTLVMRGDLSGDPSFRELLRRLQDMALGAYAHQEVPFDKLVEEIAPERDPSRSPLFQVMLAFQNTPTQSLELSGLDVTQLKSDSGTSKFDLTLYLCETHRGLDGIFEYNTDLFDGARIERMAGHFGVLLEGIVQNPDLHLSQLPLLTMNERRQLLRDWNDTAIAYPDGICLHGLFEAQSRKTPDAAAVVFEDQQITYGDLNRKANQLAHYLGKLGVTVDTLVGVCMERSIEMVVALYAVLKAGGAYVPIDPEYPRERVAFMLQDIGAGVLLTQAHVARSIPQHDGRVLCIDSEWDQVANEDTSDPVTGVAPHHLAYMIYTSGSTGRPKGAMNTHRGICNRLLWMQDQYALTPMDNVLQKTPFSFDVSVWEFFWPLLVGARLIVARPGGHKDPDYLVRLIVEQKITVLHFVPSMLRIFLAEPGVEKCRSVHHAICSVEALSFALQEEFFGKLNAKLHNLYGPTEAAVDVTHWTCQRNSQRQLVPIGRPVANTQVYILDQRLQPVPIGVSGELYIGGIQVGRGYHNRPELTSEKFLPDPFNERKDARLYKTGDMCRWLPDGSIEYLGRLDFQLKIRGFRIELGEIEAQLVEHPQIHEAVVIAREDTPGEKRLVAYYTTTHQDGVSRHAVDAAQLRTHLSRGLPDYMLPVAYVCMESLPQTPNGKLDRKALPAPELDSIPTGTYEAPQGELEARLAGIWAEVLKINRVGRNDNFFDLGGHSLLAVTLGERMRRAGLQLDVRDLFVQPTLARLAAVTRLGSTTFEAPPNLIPNVGDHENNTTERVVVCI